MLDLTQYPKFKDDISNKTTNIHPVIILETIPPIYISQNKEDIVVDGIKRHFSEVNIKIPSIKESIDLESRKFKVNNVTITLSNTLYEGALFSDLFSSRNPLNKYVKIYWKSQSCTEINECLPVYKAVVKRVDHDYKSVRIILEDLTETIMHAKLPTHRISSVNAVNEKDINKFFPMVYGDVQKAPCLLYKNVNLDTENMQRTYALADRFDVPIQPGVLSEFDKHDDTTIEFGWANYNSYDPNYGAGDSTFLYAYSGTYLKVMRDLFIHENIDEGVSVDAPGSPIVQLSAEYWDPENPDTLPGSNTALPGFRVFLRSTYDGINPTNLLSQNLLQVCYRRACTNIFVIDDSGSFDSTVSSRLMNHQYQGATEGVTIGGNEHCMDRNKNTLWETYSSIPDSILTSYDQIQEAEGGYFPISSFYTTPLHMGVGQHNKGFREYSRVQATSLGNVPPGLYNFWDESTEGYENWDMEVPHDNFTKKGIPGCAAEDRYWHLNRRIFWYLASGTSEGVDMGVPNPEDSPIGKFEFIGLPSALHIRDMFEEWYDLNYENDEDYVPLRSFNEVVPDAPVSPGTTIPHALPEGSWMGNIFKHWWGTPWDYQLVPGIFAGAAYYQANNQANTYATLMTDFDSPGSHYDRLLQASGYTIDNTQSYSGQLLDGTNIPNMLIQIARQVSFDWTEQSTAGSSSYPTLREKHPSAYITFAKDWEGNSIPGQSENIPWMSTDVNYPNSSLDTAKTIDFWDLMAFHGYSIEDCPRFKPLYINNTFRTQTDSEFEGAEDEVGSQLRQGSYRHNLHVTWNGVPKDRWSGGGAFNTSSNTPYPAFDGSTWNFNEYSNDRLTYSLFPEPTGYINTHSKKASDFFGGDGGVQWYIHFLDDYTFPKSGITAPKGLFMPSKINMPDIQSGANWGLTSFPRALHTSWMNVLETCNPQGVDSSVDNYVGLTTQNASSSWGNAQVGLGNDAVAIQFSMNEDPAEDIIDGSAVTYFYGRVSTRFGIDSSTGEVDTNLLWSESGTRTNLVSHLYIADFQTENESEDIEAQSLCVLGYGQADRIKALGAQAADIFNSLNFPSRDEDVDQFWDNQTFKQSTNTSTMWSSPVDFNGGIITYGIYGDYSQDWYIRTQLNPHHLGFKHVCELENPFEKNFYLETLGRYIPGYSYRSPITAVVKDIINREMNVDIGLHPSYAKADLYALNNNWDVAFSLNKEMDSKKLLQELAQSTPIIPLFRSNAELGMAVIKNTYDESDVNQVIKSSEVVSSSFTKTKVEKVKTMVKVKHTIDYETDNFETTDYISAYDFYGNGDYGYINGYKKEYYGLDKDNHSDSVLEYESNYVRNPSLPYNEKDLSSTTPKRLRNFLLAFNCNQHNIAKLRLPIKYVNLEVSDIIKFDNLLNNVKCFGEDYTTEYVRNGQTIYPYFMITSVTKNIKSIDIECMQMHNLQRNSSVIQSGNADFLRSKVYYDDSQINRFMNDVVLYPSTYITEGQKINCDMNWDGKLDENDLSIIEEYIDALEAQAPEQNQNNESTWVTPELGDYYYWTNLPHSNYKFDHLSAQWYGYDENQNVYAGDFAVGANGKLTFFGSNQMQPDPLSGEDFAVVNKVFTTQQPGGLQILPIYDFNTQGENSGVPPVTNYKLSFTVDDCRNQEDSNLDGTIKVEWYNGVSNNTTTIFEKTINEINQGVGDNEGVYNHTFEYTAQTVVVEGNPYDVGDNIYNNLKITCSSTVYEVSIRLNISFQCVYP